MKKVKMFIIPSCPYCRKAEGFLDKLIGEHPEYKGIEIERIDETDKPDIADQYDYWYVPTFYVDGVKLHEGVPTVDKVDQVLQAATK